MTVLKNLYDVQQLLKKYGILVHLGKRKWDIELMEIGRASCRERV